MQGRLPAQTPFWESASAPGIYFAGAVTQGSIGLKKYGIPSASASVEGFRHNARVLVRHIAQKHFGVDPPRPQTPTEEAPDLLLREATWSPELWNQRAYLSRALIFERTESRSPSRPTRRATSILSYSFESEETLKSTSCRLLRYTIIGRPNTAPRLPPC